MKQVLLPRVGSLFMASEKAAELYVDEVLDGEGRLLHLDSIGSVSGLRRDENTCVWPSDKEFLEQSERFHNGF